MYKDEQIIEVFMFREKLMYKKREKKEKRMRGYDYHHVMITEFALHHLYKEGQIWLINLSHPKESSSNSNQNRACDIAGCSEKVLRALLSNRLTSLVSLFPLLCRFLPKSTAAAE